MQSLREFGDWLKDATKLPWGQLAEKSIDAVKATAEMGKAWKEAAPKLAQLKDLDEIDSFFQLLELPVAKLAIAGLPFASVGIGLLRLYWQVTKKEATFEGAVAITAQMAYLESFRGVLERTDEETKVALNNIRLADLLERQMKKSEPISLSKDQAKKTLTQLRKSELAAAFDEALRELLKSAGLPGWQVEVLVDQVAWGTPKYLYGVVAELKNEVKPLAEFFQTDGLRIQKKFDSIEDYLAERIKPLPHQQVFDEANPLVTFDDLYVPLKVQPLDINGNKTDGIPVSINDWAIKLLRNTQEKRKVGFLEGDAGRGKSVFCRMFAASVRLEIEPAFIPILIRLRDVRVLENNLTQTLTTELEYLDFVQSDSGWLTDKNTRFLLILDGFDELLLQGRESGGITELVQQLCNFQQDSHHQCLVTGRPLALQGVERMLTQSGDLVRARLEPMANEQRNEWLGNWAKLFGEAEANGFKKFLAACPKDIGEQLAREPLLLYLGLAEKIDNPCSSSR